MVTVLYETRDKIAYITLNRPEVLNAINRQVQKELAETWIRFRDDPDAWVAVLTGKGKAFSSGADIKEMRELRDKAVTWLKQPTCFLGARQVPKPIIAAINGYAIGAGFTLALACDIRIAADNARFSFTEVALGTPVAIGTVLLSRMVPPAIALEILMSAEQINALEAYRIGMVNKVVPEEELMPTAQEVAQRIRDNAPLAVQAVKKIAIQGEGMSVEEACALAVSLQNLVERSEDASEGPRAWMEKRKPLYRAR